MGEFVDEELFLERLKETFPMKIKEYPELADKFSVESIFEEYKEYAKIIKPLVCDTGMLLDEYLSEDKKVLFEGAQGAMLDIDYGTYPYVTSSHPGANGVSEGTGIGPLYIKEAIGIIKAYTTRVGAGPFPTELFDETGDLIRERGHEYGTNTKRPRRTGWFDAVVVNQSRRMSSLTGISLMLLDVLSGFDTLKICTAYKLDGKIIHGLPATVKDIERVEPVYEEMPGWKEDITHVTSFEELPVNCQNYIRRIEELIHCPVVMFSVGPDRKQTVVLKEIKF
jgi:adenylosuccinate synthase